MYEFLTIINSKTHLLYNTPNLRITMSWLEPLATDCVYNVQCMDISIEKEISLSHTYIVTCIKWTLINPNTLLEEVIKGF